MTKKYPICYFIFDRNGQRKPGSFPKGTLISAIQLAMELGGVIYSSEGRLLWEDDLTNYQFRRPHTMDFSYANTRQNDLFCICDQCQAEWKK